MTKQADTAAPKKETRAEVEKVTLRNRDVRGVSLIKEDGTSLFLPPKTKVSVLKSDLSKSIRAQIKSGLVTQEE